MAYHELAHVLQLRNAHELGQVFHEGVAEYAEWYFAQKENYRDDSLDVFSRDEDGMLSYDESEMLKDAEAAFVFENETSSGIFQRHYQYGFRFVSFLVDTYGIEVIKDICDMSLQFTFDYTRTDMIIRVLKEATSEDVFERFEKWLPEGWDQYTEECREYMRQFEEVPVSPTER